MPRGLDKVEHRAFSSTDHRAFSSTDHRTFISTDRRAFISTDHRGCIITENHSFDTYVGRFPGADGATVGRTTNASQPRRSPAQVSMAPSFDFAAALPQDTPIITWISHRGRYVTIHVHTVAASAAASAPARPAMRGGRRGMLPGG